MRTVAAGDAVALTGDVGRTSNVVLSAAAAATATKRFVTRELRIVKGVPPGCVDAGRPEVPGIGCSRNNPYGLHAAF